ncbi:glucanase inhibitor protein 1 trypsin-like protein [Phytophthora sojae]|uniref:Glucanase inhibitor protein 1 n=2 Tax=Phytophthora sojae TaxID=67593 RepID=GIP1_PHYSO|nr:hypothetical protein PHYSODRAFT_341789 [Phytophthora sojae]XP_009538433.1 hypothetical protein PHYSODRAFT_531224 [Phytophthora sojae]XP_009538436.1 glucanase inhibitor protein 1 trypsin-like protein [Phytophthora sojae]Q945U0.1 RecName: Full=Glucanase inhibitor protein 1; Flags: Precursor [Phytophthora sojae]AAL11720.1 glucanase inhibitor protein 1 [Phytophthora sojae]EGZ06534.1 hypothetical protein PHYSODRAFT_341789 [Phytophthora sojae]EGZ06536.1 hypothetical protein PHYSODRAFT_531224 [Ph|eukprot:XP_009538431.1 hypothetical protein PHYSODRAFT_341789 [Phytophthora sojae]
MKVFPALTSALVALGTAGVEAEHVQRSLVMGGGTVPVGAKTYTVGLRTTAEGDTFCGGALISPTHVLTTATCTASLGSGPAEWAAVGTHYLNGAKDGERLKVVSAQNHTLYNPNNFAYNFAVLTLEKPSKFSPVKLPAADGSDIAPSMSSKLMGWGDTSYPNGARANELQSVELRVVTSNCTYTVGPSEVCAGGEEGKDKCAGDTGGPLIKENGSGDADDILIGLASWGMPCGHKDVASVYARVSAGLEWINSVIKK